MAQQQTKKEDSDEQRTLIASVVQEMNSKGNGNGNRKANTNVSSASAEVAVDQDMMKYTTILGRAASLGARSKRGSRN